ncbi:MAG: hypothetical protein JWP87_5945 [Labilithrix sp.]|nr:hypothetical protein [Labilithrix sp.]
MKRPRARARPRVSPVRLSPADEARIEALTVAMALAPGVYARNRMFELFANAGVRRAKSRAATLRGIVKHLGRACALRLEHNAAEGYAGRDVNGQVDFVLRYEIPVMHLTRVVELSRVELAALRLLAVRAGAPCLAADDEDRVLVETALARLLHAGGETGDLARAAQGVATPSDATPSAE